MSVQMPNPIRDKRLALGMSARALSLAAGFSEGKS